MRYASHRAGFTIVELLVVITVIVVLLALLTPALDKAIEQAERARCAANLHAFGIGVPQYALENRRAVMSSMRMNYVVTGTQGTNSPFPNVAWARSAHSSTDWTDAQSKAADWCSERMAPYVSGVNLGSTPWEWKSPWYCPSNQADKAFQNYNAAQSAGWFVPDYAYFARPGMWRPNTATRPQDLTDRSLGSGRLLMADALYFEIGNRAWWFNHGPGGWSTHDMAWGGPRQFEPNISGTNRLFGDGSASWKDATEQDRKDMREPHTDGRWVSHASGPDPSGNLNFYLY